MIITEYEVNFRFLVKDICNYCKFNFTLNLKEIDSSMRQKQMYHSWCINRALVPKEI